jgi:hypothetical protein
MPRTFVRTAFPTAIRCFYGIKVAWKRYAPDAGPQSEMPPLYEESFADFRAAKSNSGSPLGW